MAKTSGARRASWRDRARHWSKLAVAVLAGIAGEVLSLYVPHIPPFILGWDLGVIVYLGLIWHHVLQAEVETMPRWADEEDEGRALLTLLLGLAIGASLVAIGAMLGSGHGIPTLVLAGITLVCSWLLLQSIFAIHYAHLYYRTDADGSGNGLDFPGDQPPVFADFAYFAAVIGMTFQVSDVEVTNRPIRRLVLIHSVASFFFNTVLIAMTVGVAASLLG